jgi:hypothetical protein
MHSPENQATFWSIMSQRSAVFIADFLLAYTSILKMEMTFSYETSVNFEQSTRSCILVHKTISTAVITWDPGMSTFLWSIGKGKKSVKYAQAYLNWVIQKAIEYFIICPHWMSGKVVDERTPYKLMEIII